jgi:small subunit ribosomal protein S3Ae
MREIMINQATSCDLKELVRKFIPEMIGKEIEKATSSIYPLQNVFIRKVKILKAPKFDLGKLMEVCILKKHSFYFSPHSYLMICFHNIVA